MKPSKKSLIRPICYKLELGHYKIVHDATYHAFKKVTDDFGKYSKVIITKDTITDHKNYTLIPKEQNKVLQK